MAALILRPPRRPPPPAPPRPRATSGGTSATLPPLSAPIGRARCRSAATRPASPAPPSRISGLGDQRAGAARPRLGVGEAHANQSRG